MSRRANLPHAEDCSLEELLTAAEATPKKRSYMRLMAIHTLLLGYCQDQVSALYPVTRWTLCNWISRFNRSGIDDLIEPRCNGMPLKIGPTRSIAYREEIEQPNTAGQTHWTAKNSEDTCAGSSSRRSATATCCAGCTRRTFASRCRTAENYTTALYHCIGNLPEPNLVHRFV
jgi:transposase